MQAREIGGVDVVAPIILRLKHKLYLVEIAHRALPSSLPEPDDEGMPRGMKGSVDCPIDACATRCDPTPRPRAQRLDIPLVKPNFWLQERDRERGSQDSNLESPVLETMHPAEFVADLAL